MKKYSVVIGFSLLALSSCKTAKEMQRHEAVVVNLPVNFTTDGRDSTNLKSVSELFQDRFLERLVDSALVNNFVYKLYDQEVTQAEASARFFRGNNLPDLSLVSSVGFRRLSRYSMDGVGNFDTNFSDNILPNQRIPDPVLPDYFIGTRSSWEIDLWGKLAAQRKAAAYRILATQNGKQLLKTNLVADVASTYFDIILLRNEITFIDENIKLQEIATEIVSTMKQAGESNQLAVELTSSQVLASKAKRVEIEQQVIQLENELNFLLGRLPQNSGIPDRNLVIENLPFLDEGIPSSLFYNRPDIRQAENELQAANADVTTARLAFLPNITLAGDIGFHSFRPQFIFSPGAFIIGALGNMAMPLLNRRELEAQLMASNAKKKAAYTNYQMVVLKAFTEIYNHLKVLEASNRQYELKLVEVNLLRSSVASATELYKYGRATYLEVVTAQRNALQSQIELIDIRRLQYRNIIGLYRSLGGGWK